MLPLSSVTVSGSCLEVCSSHVFATITEKKNPFITSFLSFLQLVTRCMGPRRNEPLSSSPALFSHAGTTGDDCLDEEGDRTPDSSSFLSLLFIEFSLHLLHIPEAAALPGSEEETFLGPLLGSGCSSGDKRRVEW